MSVGDNDRVPPESLPTVLNSLRSTLLDPDRLVRAVASGRRRGAVPHYRRTELRWVDLRAGRRLQIVTFDSTQSFTTNVEPAAAPEAVAAVLDQPYGNWHVDSTDESVQVRVTKKGAAQVHRAPAPQRDVERQHDRTKARMLDASHPFLHAVGISDAEGRIKPSRSAKYRQVDEFLRAFAPTMDDVLRAAAGETVRLVDLGCGNAYLTFAVRAWLDQRPDSKVEVTGIDVKEQSRARNEALAAQLGWASTMSFGRSTIDAAELVDRPHGVFALHACDTATDDALARAVQWQAPVILAAPCCHHDLQRQLSGAAHWPGPYGMLARQGILRERFADVMTDALRASILRILGYRVDVMEFVDSVHTPRNTLLRAVRTGGEPPAEVVTEYSRMIEMWGVRPALGQRLKRELMTAGLDI